MSEHEKDTAFLRRCILYDDSPEHHQLEQAINQAQRDERCVWRAVLLMALLTALAAAGLYLLLGDSPQNIAEIITPFGVKVFCALGVASLICMLAFAGLGMVYREKLEHGQEECRQLAAKLFESHPVNFSTTPVPGVGKEQELIVNHSKVVAWAIENNITVKEGELTTVQGACSTTMSQGNPWVAVSRCDAPACGDSKVNECGLTTGINSRTDERSL
jgi:hypothetical protein